jgi:exopolysaccharide production protein ExoZ
MTPALSMRPAKTPRERILSIQALRGIAAMLVVLVHINNVEHKYYSTHFLRAGSWGWIGVDIFFVISGVVISLVTERQFQNTQSALTFLYHRFTRILPIYWFYYSLCLVAYLYRPELFNTSEGHHADLLRSFFLIPNQYRNIVGQAGSLTYELYFYCVFFVLMLIAPERMVSYLLAAWGAVIAGIYFICPIPDNWHVLWTASNPYVFEFLAGCLAYRLYRRISFPRLVGPALVTLSIAWLGSVVAWLNADASRIQEAFWARPLCCGLFAFLLVFGAMLMERAGQFKVGDGLKALGDWSYSIYLSHMILVEVIGLALSRWLAHSWFGIFVVAGVTLPIIVFAGYLSYTFLEHPLITYMYKRSPGWRWGRKEVAEVA